MADDVTLPGTGAVVATDDIGSSRQAQLVKLLSGANGSAASLFADPAALADALANPTTTFMGALGLVYAPSGGTALWDRIRAANKFTTFDLSAATAETTIWTPASGRKFRLLALVYFAGGNTKLTFKDNTAGTTIVVAGGSSNVANQLDFGPLGILSAAANNVLTVTRGTSATLSGTVIGTEE